MELAEWLSQDKTRKKWLAHKMFSTQFEVSRWEKGGGTRDPGVAKQLKMLTGCDIPVAFRDTSKRPRPYGPQGEQLRAWMQATGLTPTRIAEDFGCTPAAVRAWMNGDYAPQGPMLDELAKEAGISWDVITPERLTEMDEFCETALASGRRISIRLFARIARVDDVSAKAWLAGKDYRPGENRLAYVADRLGLTRAEL